MVIDSFNNTPTSNKGSNNNNNTDVTSFERFANQENWTDRKKGCHVADFVAENDVNVAEDVETVGKGVANVVACGVNGADDIAFNSNTSNSKDKDSSSGSGKRKSDKNLEYKNEKIKKNSNNDEDEEDEVEDGTNDGGDKDDDGGKKQNKQKSFLLSSLFVDDVRTNYRHASFLMTGKQGNEK